MDLTIAKQPINPKQYGLNSKQAKVIRCIVEGKKANYECYMDVYGTKSKASAHTSVSRLLSNPKALDYKAALESRAAAQAIKSNAITQERVLSEEACLAFLDIGALVDEDGFFIQNIKELPEEVRRAITGLEISEKMDPISGNTVPYYKLKFSDKGRALERLEKHLGMLKEKVEVGVEVTLKGLIAQIDGKKTGQSMIPHLKDDKNGT